MMDGIAKTIKIGCRMPDASLIGETLTWRERKDSTKILPFQHLCVGNHLVKFVGEKGEYVVAAISVWLERDFVWAWTINRIVERGRG